MTTKVTVEIENVNTETNMCVVGILERGTLSSSHVVGRGARSTFHIHGDQRVIVREATPADIQDRAASGTLGG